MPKSPERTYATPEFLSDSPLAGEDKAYFHFDDFAATLARLIASKSTRTPLTIGVSGPWGSGKTSLLRRCLRSTPFNGVANDGFHMIASPNPSLISGNLDAESLTLAQWRFEINDTARKWVIGWTTDVKRIS